jgi:hypothetical protein
MSIVVTRSLHKKIDQSNQNKNRNDIDTLWTMLINMITREACFNS